MQDELTFTRYALPGCGRTRTLTYRAADASGVLGYVQPHLTPSGNVIWRCFAPYVPFSELPGDHKTREAAAAHLAFLRNVREYRLVRLDAAE